MACEATGCAQSNGAKMRHLLAFLAGLLITAPLVGATFVGRTITLDDEDTADCIAGGGCRLITTQKLRLLEASDCRGKT